MKTKIIKVSGITAIGTAVPWLQLKKQESLSTPGNKATYLQRVFTSGGLAPSTPARSSNVGIREVYLIHQFIYFTKRLIEYISSFVILFSV